MDIEIIREKTTPDCVREHAAATFGDMVKVVVDINRRIMAMGGELHSDTEAVPYRSRDIQDPAIRKRVRDVLGALTGMI